jgi:hypothetical protein
MSKAREKAAREALAAAGVKPGAANSIIQQAAKTGAGLSKNELAFIQQNAGQVAGQTKSQVDAKAFLGTVETRQAAVSGGAAGSTPTPVSPEEAARRAAQEVENARLQSQRTDWSEYLTQVFNSYGLGSLAPRIREFVQQGYTPDTVTLKLQETPEYQQRFVGNEARRKAGLPVLSPAEYLEVESSYKQIMRTAGLPSGFYDNPDDFAKFIGIDVSPAELKQRVDVAALTLENADPLFKQQLRQFYNLNDGDMIAYALDPERALPTLLRQTQATQFGAEAARQGLQVQRTMAETYAGMGVTQEQARQGFEQVAQITPEAQRLSSVFAGQEAPIGQEEVTSAVFTGEGSAEYQRRLKRLSEMEQSLFAGQSGVGRGSLGQAQTGRF